MIQLPIDPKSIKPKVRGKADFFSWQLYRYVKKYKLAHHQHIWLGTWNCISGVDAKKKVLYIGNEIDEEGFICARNLRELCCHSDLSRFCYTPLHDTLNWVDITEQFWEDYFKQGVCAIHGDFAHNWEYKDNDMRRVCAYCGKLERLNVVREVVTREVWK